MIIVDVTCAACPAHLRLLVATKVTLDGAPTYTADIDSLTQQLALRRWSMSGPLCPDCADHMRRTTN